MRGCIDEKDEEKETNLKKKNTITQAGIEQHNTEWHKY